MGKLHTYIDDTESIPKRADSLIAKVKEYLPKSKVKLVSSAYEFAAQAHSQQSRLSGDPFIEHPLQTALYLANLQLDNATIAAEQTITVHKATYLYPLLTKKQFIG